MTDELAMARAIELSKGGFPAPNPHVGCVLVKGGAIVGEGYHDHAGSPHAEIVALQHAGAAAKGATAYVTLEPCNHHGRTPPCASALVQAGVSRVVVAVPDPNPRATGGTAHLRSAGLAVDVGLLAAEAAKANSQFLTAMSLGRPVIVLKAAMSLDGRIAMPSGESKWITGEESRQEVHRLRAELGAVLVGRGTVAADDPQLTARIPGVVNQPVRIVLDPRAQLSRRERVFGPEAPTLRVVCQSDSDEDLRIPCVDGKLDLHLLLANLWGKGISGILVEGGSNTLGSFVEARLFEKLKLFTAPRVLGKGLPWVDQILGARLPQQPELAFESVQMFGPDLCMTLVKSSEL